MNPDKENQNLLCYRYTTALKLDGPRAIAVSYIPLGLGLITPHYKHWEGGSRTHARGFGDLCATVTLLPKLVETKGIEPLLGGCKPPVLPLSLSPQSKVDRGRTCNIQFGKLTLCQLSYYLESIGGGT